MSNSSSASPQHHRPELELLSDQQRLEAFFSQSPDGFFFMMLDAPIRWHDASNQPAVLEYVFQHQRVTKVNAAMLNQYRATEAEFIGLTPHDFFAHDLETGKQLWRNMFDSGRLHVETFEYRLDGTSMWVEGDYSCLHNAEGEIIGHFGIQRDISDRKQAEEALRHSEQKFRAIFDSMFQFIGLLTPEGRLIEANRTALDAIAAKLEDVVDQPFWDTPWWTHSPKLQQQLKIAIAQAARGELVRFEAKHLLVNGNEICVDFSLKPVFDDGGQVIMLIPEGRDISDRKLAELELQTQKQDLARSNAELQQFAYVASHDLQEPLRMIISYLDLLERRYAGQLDAKADQFIAYAVNGATRMQTLINDLLSYSRVGTRQQTIQPVDCTLIVQTVLNNLKVAIEQNQASITYSNLPQINADPTQMAQLFQNLIGNAIKFKRAEPLQVHITAHRQDRDWLFSIRDNGIGIETQYLDRIFVIFQRLNSRTEYPGTGIGLAICKKIVESHGGRLWVESTLGEGSIFHFTLLHSTGSP